LGIVFSAIRHGVGQLLLLLGFAVVREREIDVEGERTRLAGQPTKYRLRFLKLILRQPGGGRAGTSLSLEPLNIEDLALGFGLGAGREVLANALPVQPTGDPENDFPGGIREF
jgi:hypothetical protein